MNLRRVARCSLGLNLVLGLALGITLWTALKHRSAPSAAFARPDALRDAASPAQHRPETLSASARAVPWDALWRHGYPAALDQLRSAGFPNTVIQDILIGKLKRSFGPPLLALRRDPVRFWDPVQRRKSDENDPSQHREEQARVLESERNRLVQDLVGLDWADIESELSGRPGPLDGLVEGLPAGVRSRARQVLEKYDALERDVIQSAGGVVGVPERRGLDKLYQDKLADLKQFLAPSELEEFEVRASPTAERLKQLDLVGFEPSEEEFRAIHRIRRAFDVQDAPAASATAPADPSAQWQRMAALEGQMEAALGPARYQEYRRSMDYTFRGLVELAGQYDLPPDAPAQVHSFRESVLQSMHEVQESTALTPEQQASVLREIRADAQTAVRQLLGEPAYRRYRQMQISGWLANTEP